MCFFFLPIMGGIKFVFFFFFFFCFVSVVVFVVVVVPSSDYSRLIST